MDDRAIVAAITGGDPRGLDRAYRRYADRLYAYSRSMIGDPDTAHDVVHDVFVLASQRIGQLREPDRLRPWLYAIARTESLHRLRDRKRMLPSDLPDDVITADTQDVTRTVHVEQVRELVRAAAGGLSEADREIIDLVIDYDFGPTDIAAALDISPNNAAARLSRARTGLATCLGVLLVARTGKETCTDLAGQLAGWDGLLTPLLRKRLNRHVDSCVECGACRREQLSPAALLGISAAFPLLAVGEGVVLPSPAPFHDGGTAAGSGTSSGGAGRGPAHQPTQPARPGQGPGSQGQGPGSQGPGSPGPGSPGPGSPGPGPTSTGPGPTSTVRPPAPAGAPYPPTSTIKPGRRIRAALAGAAVLLVLLACGVLALLRQPTATFNAGAPATSEAQNASTSSPEPGIVQPSGDPSPGGPSPDNPDPDDDDDDSDPPPVSPSTSGYVIIIPAEMYVYGKAVATCTSGSAKTYRVAFTATIYTSSISSASVIWHDPTRHRELMVKNGRTATYTTPNMTAGTFTWSVWVKAANGNIGDTNTVTRSNPCLSPSPSS